MAAEMQAVRISAIIKTTPGEVYRAFTNDMCFREWLCDSAYVQNREGGKLFLVWNVGYTATGEFIERDPDKAVSFTWHGLGEPASTQVRVDLAETTEGTRVTLVHDGLGIGDGRARTIDEIQHGWETGLENLQSVLETGDDLRLVRRPMLGILPGELNEEVAAKIGVPVKAGIRLEGTVPGMGAEAAGLQKDDVIVDLGGRVVRDFNTLVLSLEDRRAGDSVPVVIYRGVDKRTLSMTLSGRPMAAVPPTAQGLADALQHLYDEQMATLDSILQGVTEAEASKKPGDDEWNVKEILAHLTIGERDTQTYLTGLLSGDEPVGALNNVQPRYVAFARAYPTLAEVRAELGRARLETITMIASLPDDFVRHTGTYVRLGRGMLEGSGIHGNTHFDQIRAAIDAARS